jgi:hypothetical protein
VRPQSSGACQYWASQITKYPWHTELLCTTSICGPRCQIWPTNLAHGHIDNGAALIAEHLGTRSNGSHHLQRSARSMCSFTHTSYWFRHKRTYPLSHTYLCALSRTHVIGLDINAHILSVSHASPHPLSHAPPLLPPSLSLIRMEIGRVWEE